MRNQKYGSRKTDDAMICSVELIFRLDDGKDCSLNMMEVWSVFCFTVEIQEVQSGQSGSLKVGCWYFVA
jgi:hypothetical protein